MGLNLVPSKCSNSFLPTKTNIQKFWNTLTFETHPGSPKTKPCPLVVGNLYMDHPRDHSLFGLGLSEIIYACTLQCIYIYMYTYIYSITSIIYIYIAIDIAMIYVYITYILYIIYNLKIHKPVRCPHRLGSQTVIGGFQLLSLQGVQGFFLAVVKGCVCFQGK